MPNRTSLTEDQVDALVGWYEEGRSNQWIADRLPIGAEGVEYLALSRGALKPAERRRRLPVPEEAVVHAGPSRTLRRFTRSEDEEIVRLETEEGLRPGQIARRLDRAISSIRIRLMHLARLQAEDEEAFL
jgi:DNA-binding CsgD family transcriptional regulator